MCTYILSKCEKDALSKKCKYFQNYVKNNSFKNAIWGGATQNWHSLRSLFFIHI